VRGCLYGSGTFGGSFDEALRKGIEALDASPVDDETYTYLADETGSSYMASSSEVAKLGAALLSGYRYSEAYSIWCSNNGSEVS
jgi:hypothetical protein